MYLYLYFVFVSCHAVLCLSSIKLLFNKKKNFSRPHEKKREKAFKTLVKKGSIIVKVV